MGKDVEGAVVECPDVVLRYVSERTEEIPFKVSGLQAVARFTSVLTSMRCMSDILKCRDSSVCVLIGPHTVLRREITFQFLAEAKYFFLLQSAQTVADAHSNSHSNATEAMFPHTPHTTEVNNA